MKVGIKQLREFLRESNAIEQVYSDEQLQHSLEAWDYINQFDELTKDRILETHRILMREDAAWSEPALRPKFTGVYRDIPIYIGYKEGMKYDEIPMAISKWVSVMNTTKDFKDELTESTEKTSRHLHVVYETIHPFADGNGRTGRIFMNWWRIRRGLPLLIIHADYENPNGEQRSYYKWFTETHG